MFYLVLRLIIRRIFLAVTAVTKTGAQWERFMFFIFNLIGRLLYGKNYEELSRRAALANRIKWNENTQCRQAPVTWLNGLISY